jgi:hypothetical protein
MPLMSHISPKDRAVGTMDRLLAVLMQLRLITYECNWSITGIAIQQMIERCAPPNINPSERKKT